VREKITERGLPMKILDAEYQFDRHKLTFFFEADKRIDFRDLVSELFSQYKTRIWMQQVDTSSLPLHDAGTELAKATGFIPADRDDNSFRTSSSSSFETVFQQNQVQQYPLFQSHSQMDMFDKRCSTQIQYSDPWVHNTF
jgi:hypothetical protein